jgi:hypothetical protein
LEAIKMSLESRMTRNDNVQAVAGDNSVERVGYCTVESVCATQVSNGTKSINVATSGVWITLEDGSKIHGRPDIKLSGTPDQVTIDYARQALNTFLKSNKLYLASSKEAECDVKETEHNSLYRAYRGSVGFEADLYKDQTTK